MGVHSTSLLPSFTPFWSHLTDLCPENAEFGGQVATKENGKILFSKIIFFSFCKWTVV
jgi:hypothetical protein